ncbi:MBL fold metallo-hydrolase [Symbioplanes lichenis]|uniref:MBL fold metallo-hydrolase n=1 Tax=Symbioplanes lichenis TaxID=1629072 RepID=UPI00273A0EFB|nr:MBL fold metallo-hydrolase [Actinoplanes lichenis]
MTEKITIGDFTVTVLTDGASHLPPSAYPGADFERFPELLDATGTYRIRLGAHLVQGPAGTFLVDAGAGPLSMPFPAELAAANGLGNPPPHMAQAGELPESLAAAGVAPEEISAIFVTHLHLDHVGWLAHFPNATVHYGAEDWPLLVGAAPADDPTRVIMEAAGRAGVLRTYPAEDAEVLPGVTVMRVPGHTPGHVVIALSSGGEQLWFTGDLVELPAQLTDREIHFMTDVDREAAAGARARLFARARAEGIVIAAAHLSDPSFRRVTAENTWADATVR